VLPKLEYNSVALNPIQFLLLYLFLLTVFFLYFVKVFLHFLPAVYCCNFLQCLPALGFITVTLIYKLN
jgi:hypothetical protein